jgi:hypothetical protein
MRIPALVAFAVMVAWLGIAPAEDKKVDDPEKKSGTVVGMVTAKDKNWIEVKADGEEKGRRYVPKWIGGAPAQGGGLEKKMLKTFADLKIGSRIRIEWEFEERARAVKIEVLKAPDEKK